MRNVHLGPDFDGDTYDAEQDHKRLTGLLGRVFDFMRDGQWHTLREVSQRCNGQEASVSARLRDLRKDKFGAFEVERRRDKECRGRWFYRLVIEDQAAQRELF